MNIEDGFRPKLNRSAHRELEGSANVCWVTPITRIEKSDIEKCDRNLTQFNTMQRADYDISLVVSVVFSRVSSLRMLQLAYSWLTDG